VTPIIDATDLTFDAAVREQGIAIVDFWAVWCAPCRAIAPVLERIADERDDVRVVKVDSDANVATMARFGIRSLPTLLFFKDGALVDQIVGAVGRDRIDRVIDHHVGAAV
jgi:thioredoxin 1